MDQGTGNLAATGWVGRVVALLPRGGTLPDQVWERRHSALLAVLVAHVPLVIVFAVVRGVGVREGLWLGLPLILPALAARFRWRRRWWRSCFAATGLIASSAVLVFLSGGAIEMHFHFFVMVTVLSLYQEWLPFLVAIGLVVVEHGVIGVTNPHAVYDHASAWNRPWTWAFIHGLFVLAASAASIAAWGINERDNARVDVEVRRLQRAREAALHRQAHLDPLTGVANRWQLMGRLQTALGRAGRPGGVDVALLFVDLDDFKRVNDRQGHETGDRVLVAVARRLAAVVRENDVVARLGGDEFLLVCEDMDERSAVTLGERLVAAVSQPISIADAEHTVVGVSVGIAMADSPGIEPEQLLQDADVAMYRAKQLGKNRIQVFDVAMRVNAQVRTDANELLRSALEAGRLHLQYQPVFDGEHAMVAVEALLRVEDDEGNLLAPQLFIDVAEQSGLIIPIGRWVLRQACRDLATWRRDGTDLRVMVNLSARQAIHAELVDDVRSATAAAGIPTHALVIELTETALLDASQSTWDHLNVLRADGVHIGIDDFGVGHASLRYLQTLPVSFVKVDRSFVAGLPDDRQAKAIVSAITALASELDLYCCAAGVETQEQLDCLQAMAPTIYLQGYLLARPAPAQDIARLVRPAVDSLSSRRFDAGSAEG